MRGSVTTVAKRGSRRTAWLAPAAILAASSVTVTACQSGRAAVRAPARAATVTKVTISPGQGSVDDRSSKPVAGAWYWLDDKTVWFRPRTYWPAYDRVRFTAHLAGVRGANGVYGAADLVRRFTIGASLVTVASASSHRMKVWVNG